MNRQYPVTIKSILYTEELKASIFDIVFACDYAKKAGFALPVNRLCRVEFPNKLIHKAPVKKPFYMETLLIGKWVDNAPKVLHLIIAGLTTDFPIAYGYYPERKIEISQEYRDAEMIDKMTDAEITMFFNTIWDNPAVIEPPETPYTIELNIFQ